MTVGELKKELDKFDDNLEVKYEDDLYGWKEPNPGLVDNEYDGTFVML